MIQVFLLLPPTPSHPPLSTFSVFNGLERLYSRCFPGARKKQAQGNGENWISWTQCSHFLSSCVCYSWMLSIYGKVASRCLFPRSWDERALQILWASNQGLYCQTSQTGVTRVHLWETPGVNTWPRGDPSTVMRGEWTALGGGPLSNQRAGEMDQEDSFFTWYTGEKYMLCLSRKAVWRFK